MGCTGFPCICMQAVPFLSIVTEKLHKSRCWSQFDSHVDMGACLQMYNIYVWGHTPTPAWLSNWEQIWNPNIFLRTDTPHFLYVCVIKALIKCGSEKRNEIFYWDGITSNEYTSIQRNQWYLWKADISIHRLHQKSKIVSSWLWCFVYALLGLHLHPLWMHGVL